MSDITLMPLFPLTNQFELKNGSLNVGGYLRVMYAARTDVLPPTYKDSDGSATNPEWIQLDNNARAAVYVDVQFAYNLFVYDKDKCLLWSQYNLFPESISEISVTGMQWVYTSDGITGDGLESNPLGFDEAAIRGTIHYGSNISGDGSEEFPVDLNNRVTLSGEDSMVLIDGTMPSVVMTAHSEDGTHQDMAYISPSAIVNSVRIGDNAYGTNITSAGVIVNTTAYTGNVGNVSQTVVSPTDVVVHEFGKDDVSLTGLNETVKNTSALSVDGMFFNGNGTTANPLSLNKVLPIYTDNHDSMVLLDATNNYIVVTANNDSHSGSTILYSDSFTQNSNNHINIINNTGYFASTWTDTDSSAVSVTPNDVALSADDKVYSLTGISTGLATNDANDLYWHRSLQNQINANGGRISQETTDRTSADGVLSAAIDGIAEQISGGFKVYHDSSLSGEGTSADPLSVISAESALKAVGDINGNSITATYATKAEVTGYIDTVSHDDTISGTGKADSPLGVIGGVGGKTYTGIDPIVVDNVNDTISADTYIMQFASPMTSTTAGDTVVVGVDTSNLATKNELSGYISTVSHDDTISGTGKADSPLGVIGGVGGKTYTGVSPIVVDNVNDSISAETCVMQFASPMTSTTAGDTVTVGVDLSDLATKAEVSGYISTVSHDDTISGTGKVESPLGVDTSTMATKSDLDSKQDKLTAGENISIVRTGAEEKTTESTSLPVQFIANGDNLTQYKIYGNLSQDGTPSISSPVDVKGIGEIVTVSNNGTETNIILTSPLYKIGDDYVDYIDFEEGKVYRSCKRINLSTLTWTANVSSGKYRFQASISDYVPNASAGRATNVYFNRFYYSSSDAYGVGFGHSNKNIYIYVSEDVQTVSQLQAWLGTNYSYIVYPSSSTVVEDIQLPNIGTINGTNNLDIDGSIKPSLIQLKYLQNAGSNELVISTSGVMVDNKIYRDAAGNISAYDGSQFVDNGMREVSGNFALQNGNYTALSAGYAQNTASATNAENASKNINGDMLAPEKYVWSNQLPNISDIEKSVNDFAYGNQFYFLPKSNVTYEVSTDGETWTEYEVTDQQHATLFGATEGAVSIILNVASSPYLRITMVPDHYVYVDMFSCYTSSNTRATLTLEKLKNAEGSTWETYATGDDIYLGQPQWHTLYHASIAADTTNTSRYGKIRFTIHITGGSGTTCQVSRILYFGSYGYQNKLYTIDRNKNMIFNGDVYVGAKYNKKAYYTGGADVAVADGGTGASNAKGAMYNLLDLNNEDADFTDNSSLIGAYYPATAENGTIYKRPITRLWNYIKSKLGITSAVGNVNQAVYVHSSGQIKVCTNPIRLSYGNTMDYTYPNFMMTGDVTIATTSMPASTKYMFSVLGETTSITPRTLTIKNSSTAATSYRVFNTSGTYTQYTVAAGESMDVVVNPGMTWVVSRIGSFIFIMPKIDGSMETVLWTGSTALSTNPTITASENLTNFEYISLMGKQYKETWGEIEFLKFVPTEELDFSIAVPLLGSSGDALRFNQNSFIISGTNITFSRAKQFSITTSGTATGANSALITKIIGINRK